MKSRRSYPVLFTLAALLLAAGCHKKPPAPAPQPAPPPPAPTASLSANPDTITAGQSTTLTWQTQNATEISISSLGTVAASGSQSVSPTDSTTYALTAKGPGGTQEATARVTVNPAPPPPQPTETEEELFAKNVQDVYFDYDKYDLRPEAQTSLSQAADFLKQHTGIAFTIEGHCDERGSTEYNLALGDKRANAAKDALVNAGVDAGRIKTISYGKERPFCTEHNEQCWQQNRRAHFVLTK